METTSRFSTPEALEEDLFQACLESGGEEVTMRVLIAAYTQMFVRKDAESGWEHGGSSDLRGLQMGTAAVKDVLKQYTELKVRFPQVTTADERETTAENSARVMKESYAEINVPAEFSKNFSGFAFRELLAEKYAAQLEKLAKQMEKKLRRYELRTARMFAKDDSLWEIPVRISKNSVFTDVWEIPYENVGLYPMLWHTEVCGLGGLLAERLTEQMKIDKKSVSAKIQRDTKQQCLTVILQIKEEEEQQHDSVSI